MPSHRSLPGVLYVEPNYLASEDGSLVVPDDGLRPQPWGLARIGALDGWGVYPGSYAGPAGAPIARFTIRAQGGATLVSGVHLPVSGLPQGVTAVFDQNVANVAGIARVVLRADASAVRFTVGRITVARVAGSFHAYRGARRHRLLIPPLAGPTTVLHVARGGTVIDHIAVNVSDYARSKAFYLAALAPLGYELVMEFEDRAGGFGVGGKPDLWLREGGPLAPVHIAIASPDRKTVDAFHAAALAAGGTDNGGPGLRPHYHASYYGAFVLDPDGHNVEAVNHGTGGGPT